MSQIATITSKMQLTLPVSIARRFGLKKGQKVFVSEQNDQIVITPAEKLVESLAGSLRIPRRWEGKTIDQIIQEAKEEHFRKKKT